MKITVNAPVEINVKQIKVELPVRYEEEDIPNDFPLRRGDTWIANIDVDTGQINGWPVGESAKFYMKVVDGGVYTLYSPTGTELAKIEGDYVPHGVIPGEYGDYVNFSIDENGIITNWPKNPDFDAFFPESNA